MDADEALARALQAEEHAAAAAPQSSAPSDQRAEFAARIQGGMATALRHASRPLQAQARAVMPLQQLRARAAAAVLASAPESGLTLHDAFLDALLHWFKSWFTWVDKPPCARCGGPTSLAGMAQPTAQELAEGGSRVEAYACADPGCGAPTRFPRLNEPSALLRTRRGRCGEYANCFTLCCHAAGLRARYVLDFSDHVWTEVWSAAKRRWVHADSCEAARDTPRLYSAGWGKKLSYVFAFSAVDGAADVTSRYAPWADARPRRTAVDERWLAAQLAALTATTRGRLSPAAAAAAAERDAADLASIVALHEADGSAAPQDLPGRQSGALEWRAARGELGASGAAAGAAAGTRDALAATLAAALSAAFASQPPSSQQQPPRQ